MEIECEETEELIGCVLSVPAQLFRACFHVKILKSKIVIVSITIHIQRMVKLMFLQVFRVIIVSRFDSAV